MNPLFDFSVDRENKTVTIVRTFHAGLPLVWEAFTTAELLDQWWAPKPFTARSKYMHFEEGGRRFYAMLSPDGQEHWSVQTFSNITPQTGYTMMSAFADKDENPDLPGSVWVLRFSEQDGITTVHITITNESRERMERMIEMGFKEGFAKGLQQLDALLPEWGK